MIRHILRKTTREPLVRFLLIGIAVFALYGLVDDSPASIPSDSIIVTPEKIEQLADGFEEIWRRQPAEAELEGMIENYIREEVYVREALALGLDQDDAVIRNRLRQKMEFLSASGAALLEPSEDELRAYFETIAAQLTPDPRIAFEQVFLGESITEENIRSYLAALNDGKPRASLGRPTILPETVPLAPAVAVDGTFGEGFFDAVRDLEPNAWHGPIASGYGDHLVRLTERSRPGRPLFDAVRERVLQDWQRQKTEELAAQRYTLMRDRFEVVRPSPAAVEQIR